MPLTIGQPFGAYEITGMLGSGGMGEVYRATDTALAREVAVKVLPQALARDADWVARFEREARALAALNHPNIAQIYGLERGDGAMALVMELVEGPTLAERLASGPVPADEALQIALQIADALEAAHRRQVVHRDLKPANIKLRPDGTAKVLDFGIAKVIEVPTGIGGSQAPQFTTPAMTEAGMILGTAAYMSPEQARGKEVDQRSDIWAFGCVLYEMLTGQPAFGGEDVTTTLARVLEREPDLAALPRAAPPALRHTLELCLAKDPRQRIADIRDARLALQGSLARPSNEDAGGNATLRRRRAPTLALAIAAVTGALVGALLLRLSERPEPQPATRFEHAVPADVTFRRGGRRILAISPDGRDLVYNTAGGLYLRAMGELEARLIPGTEEDLVDPVFSPDGRQLAYWAASGQLKRLMVTGGAPVVVADGFQNPYGLSWANDGTILVGQREGIYRVPATGGTPGLIIEIDQQHRIYGPEMLPDADSVLYSVSGAGGDWDKPQIVVQSLSSGERKLLVDGGSDAHFVADGYLVYAIGNDLVGTAFAPAGLNVSGNRVLLVQGVTRADNGNTGAAQFAVSRNGTLAYLSNSIVSASRKLVWVDRGGREEPLSLPSGRYQNVRISPDGTRVVLSDGNTSGLWIWDFEREARILFGAAERARFDGVWTPDGSRIAFDTFNSLGSIYWKAANNTGEAELLASGLAKPRSASPRPYGFSPDGQELIFRDSGSTDSGNNIGMIRIGADNQEPVWLLDRPYDEINAKLSPDGHWLAYQSNESGRYEIYVRPYPNVDDDQVLISNAGGVQPLWARNGRELFYLEAGPPTRLVAVAVEARDNRIIPGARELVLDWPYVDEFDVSADGQRFLAVKVAADEGASPKFIIVQNWFEELRQQVAPSR